MKRPLLKYSVIVDENEDKLLYRGKNIEISDKKGLFLKVKDYLDGNNDLASIASLAGIDLATASECIEFLVDKGAVVYVEQNFEVLSGEKAFWLLEKDLCDYKFYKRNYYAHSDLEAMVASGSAPENVAIGYLIELGYLLRNVPCELACSINSSFDEKVRKLFVHFFEEEYTHGELMYKELARWLGGDFVLSLRPLPATFGLLNVYRWMASHPLLYATALMHDEGSPFDPIPEDEKDVYFGLLNRYNIPKYVTQRFLWHANLDRNSDHGFFPLEIFKCFNVVDIETFNRLRTSLKGLFEQQGSYRHQIVDFYSKFDYRERADFRANF